MVTRVPFAIELTPAPSVLDAFEYIRTLPYPLLLESSTVSRSTRTEERRAYDNVETADTDEGSYSDNASARYSFAMAAPEVVFSANGLTVEITETATNSTRTEQGRALDFVARWLDDKRSSYKEQPSSSDYDAQPQGSTLEQNPHVAESELPPFIGGIAGYVGYEYGGVLEHIQPSRIDNIDIPDAFLGGYSWTVAWDHQTGRCWVIGFEKNVCEDIVDQLSHLREDAHTNQPSNFKEEANIDHQLSSSRGANSDQPSSSRKSGNVNHLSTFRESGSAPITPNSTNTALSSLTEAEYHSAIETTKEYIRAGDIFQANITQQFRCEYSENGWNLYRHISDINEASFSSYFNFDGVEIISVSPERFLLLNKDGAVETRPIKGTRPRGSTRESDKVFSSELLLSQKDRAEHVMIVDVLRNDISRVCEYGSVRVPALMRIEAHPTIFHMVSTIVGQLRADKSSIDLFHACFPGGSITGAPKVRAMEIISELEPVRRNVYCGSIGYFSLNGTMDSSIAIRTIVLKSDVAYFSAGGGIVADSNASDEYAESLQKAKAMMTALNTSL